jgi:tRNA pseudouridine55 synthase
MQKNNMSRRLNKPQVKHKKNDISGWINLHKPIGLTSNQALSAIKRLLHPKKIGHAGTLDPLATGVLPIALGEATKTVPYMMDGVKSYRFTVSFGRQTSTDDLEGEVIAESKYLPSEADILAVLPKFIGDIEQIPPKFSAIKIDGKRAYKLARAGEKIEMKARVVQIDNLRVISRKSDSEVELEVVCGKGTYVRSLARDIAIATGSVGHVSSLHRSMVGNFNEKNNILLENIEKAIYDARIKLGNSDKKPYDVQDVLVKNSILLPVDVPLDDILAINICEKLELRLRQGMFINVNDLTEVYALVEGLEYRLILIDKLVALAKFDRGKLQPFRVFNY